MFNMSGKEDLTPEEISAMREMVVHPGWKAYTKIGKAVIKDIERSLLENQHKDLEAVHMLQLQLKTASYWLTLPERFTVTDTVKQKPLAKRNSDPYFNRDDVTARSGKRRRA